MKYQLMCKDEVRATFELNRVRNAVDLTDLKVNGYVPTLCTPGAVLQYLERRNAAKHRKHLSRFLEEIGCKDVIGFLDLTHGISINDCYWVKKDSEPVSWSDVSPYTNDYDEVVQKLSFDGTGLFGETMSSTSPEFGTSGNYDKCWVRDDSGIHMYKCGSGSVEVSGREPYNEALAAQVFTGMNAGIDYTLVKYRGRVATVCDLFNDEKLSFVPYGVQCPFDTELVPMLNFYDSIEHGDLFRRILICDAVTFNIDRHLGNHGILCNSMSGEVVKAAPGFDYNLAFFPYAPFEQLQDPVGHIKGQVPRIGSAFVDTAITALTDEIREDLLKLKGIELMLPFYDEFFPIERVKYLTDLANVQIDAILTDTEPIYPDYPYDIS